MWQWWRGTACPCEPVEQVWIDQRMSWLTDKLPDNVLTGRPVLLPRAFDFPDRWDQSLASVEQLAYRLAQRLAVPRDRIRVEVAGKRRLTLVNDWGQQLPWSVLNPAADLASQHTLRVERDLLVETSGLVAHLGRQLVEARLLDLGLIDAEQFDYDLTVDLAAIHLGLGVFLANAVRHWTRPSCCWPNLALRQPQFFTPKMFGWALARVAWSRVERRPEWAAFLAGGPRRYLRQSLRHLTKIS